jgi:hypothetical protein
VTDKGIADLKKALPNLGPPKQFFPAPEQ